MFVLANVMLPSIAEYLGFMFVLLLPIALIEAVVLSRRHLLAYRDSFVLSLRANWRSTVIGLPLGYALAVVGIIPAGLFVSLLPAETGSAIGAILFNALGHGGTIPGEFNEVGYFLGTLLVMVPYFLVTLRIERTHIAKLRKDLDGPRLTTTVRLMNDITYVLLATPIVIGAVKAVIQFR
jgi:hypothetical protein